MEMLPNLKAWKRACRLSVDMIAGMIKRFDGSGRPEPEAPST